MPFFRAEVGWKVEIGDWPLHKIMVQVKACKLPLALRYGRRFAKTSPYRAISQQMQPVGGGRLSHEELPKTRRVWAIKDKAYGCMCASRWTGTESLCSLHTFKQIAALSKARAASFSVLQSPRFNVTLPEDTLDPYFPLCKLTTQNLHSKTLVLLLVTRKTHLGFGLCKTGHET